MKPDVSVPHTIVVPLKELLKGENGHRFSEKIELLIDQITGIAAKKAGIPPSEIIKIVEEGKVYWMTGDEVRTFLQTKPDKTGDGIEQLTHDALFGDVIPLSQDVRITCQFAKTRLNDYTKDQRIPDKDIHHFAPKLSRMDNILHYSLKSLFEVETEINETQRKNPIVRQFNDKIHVFNQSRQSGNLRLASKIAKELMEIKNDYSRVNRGIESNISQSRQLRIDIQQQKKALLDCHINIVDRRKNVLNDTIDRFQNTLDRMYVSFDDSDLSNKSSIPAKTYLEEKKRLDTDRKEYNLLHSEHTYLVLKEQETSSVVSRMQETLSLEDRKEPEITDEFKPVQDKQEIKPAEPGISHTRRMSAMERREKT